MGVIRGRNILRKFALTSCSRVRRSQHCRPMCLDQQQQLVPVGVPGESVFRRRRAGARVLAQCGADGGEFVPHPFSAEAGTRLYRTGDLVRYLANGEIEFLRRVDEQRALPAPTEADAAQEVGLLGPIEELVAGIWSELLHLSQLRVADNFFELGGHSLLATQLISRLRTAFSLELPLRLLFEAPTVAGQARAIEEALKGEAGVVAPPLLPLADRSRLPLSFAQQRLWFLDQLEPGSTAYNMPIALRLRGPLDVAALEQSFSEVVRRHEVLRTRIESCGGHAGAGDAGSRDSACCQSWIWSHRRRGARGGSQTHGGCGRAASIRSGRGGLLRRDAAAVGSGRACAAVYDAPHRQRRLVDGDSDAGSERAVCSVCGGRRVSAGGVADPVCGLCGVAARVAAGRSAGRAVGILAHTVGGCAGSAGVADGSMRDRRSRVIAERICHCNCRRS